MSYTFNDSYTNYTKKVEYPVYVLPSKVARCPVDRSTVNS